MEVDCEWERKKVKSHITTLERGIFLWEAKSMVSSYLLGGFLGGFLCRLFGWLFGDFLGAGGFADAICGANVQVIARRAVDVAIPAIKIAERDVIFADNRWTCISRLSYQYIGCLVIYAKEKKLIKQIDVGTFVGLGAACSLFIQGTARELDNRLRRCKCNGDRGAQRSYNDLKWFHSDCINDQRRTGFEVKDRKGDERMVKRREH